MPRLRLDKSAEREIAEAFDWYVYPQGWTEELKGDAEGAAYFIDYADQMKELIAGAASNGEALLVYLN